MSTFQLESLPYQTDAVEAVVCAFEGLNQSEVHGLGPCCCEALIACPKEEALNQA
jgi:hypothetical protein